MSLLRPLGPDLAWGPQTLQVLPAEELGVLPCPPAPTYPQSPLWIVSAVSLSRSFSKLGTKTLQFAYLILYTLECHGSGYSIILPRCGGIQQDVSEEGRT